MPVYRFLLLWRPAKAHVNLKLRAVSPGPSLLARMLARSAFSSDKLYIKNIYTKVRQKAKIRNRYNQAPHQSQKTEWESDKTQENTTYMKAKRSAISQQVTTRLQETDITVWTRKDMALSAISMNSALFFQSSGLCVQSPSIIPVPGYPLCLVPHLRTFGTWFLWWLGV